MLFVLIETASIIIMASAKPSTSPPSPPDLDILGDQVTLHPGGYVAPPEKPGEDGERNLVEHMARFRESPLDFLREVSLHVSGQGWRAYDDVLGQPIFYSGFSENMKSMVMRTPMLRKRIKELASRRVQVEEAEGLLGSGGEVLQAKQKREQEIEESLREVTLEMTDAMICKMESKRFIRGAYYMCTQLLTRAYHQGIHVSSEEVLRLRSVAEAAAKKKQSIIFLPCHRSHVDYVSLQLICYRLGIALPTVVAGDNLNFPVVGSFLQHAGASTSFLNYIFPFCTMSAFQDIIGSSGPRYIACTSTKSCSQKVVADSEITFSVDKKEFWR